MGRARTWLIWLGGAAAVFALAAAVALPRLERVLLHRIAGEAEATLRIALEGLSSTLASYRPLPMLIAERPILAETLRDPTNSGLLPFVNEQLRMTAFTLAASDVYLMDLEGTTIAASNYRGARSFVGENFAYRPYFLDAVDGGLGQFFALGTTSGERGYFIAAPVLDTTRIIGVLAVKLLVDPFEEAWRGGPGEVVVTDDAGVVFMSSREDWHYRTLRPLSPDEWAGIEATRQYPLDRIAPLATATEDLGGGLALLSVGEGGESFVRREAMIADAGWNVMVLAPAAPARTQALVILGVAGLLLLLAGLAVQVVHLRRARARERAAEARAAQAELERRVEQRTSDLNVANARLRSEIDERRATEGRLRATQNELIQAGKLAALGQMSAALSHEINQPLAAVKSYADNAATFLDRARPGEARENVLRISEMADRMATISGHLRNFARRPQEWVEPVELGVILADAIALMEAEAKARGAVFDLAPPGRPVWAMGGRVRLQQVVVNLLSNALDAMEGVPSPRIEVALADGQGRVEIRVRDRGPGLTQDVEEKLFDPFFTTKRPGKGLGLGLSISYNIVEDFGGRLSARNAEGGGAVFTVSLLAATAPGTAEAAE